MIYRKFFTILPAMILTLTSLLMAADTDTSVLNKSGSLERLIKKSGVYNAANERAVALFLEGRIALGDIAPAVEQALEALGTTPGATRSDILNADAAARRLVEKRF